MDFLLGAGALLIFIGLLAVVAWVVWRLAKGHSKLEALTGEITHKHYWSPWEEHEVALYDGSKLVRYAPGQLRTCLDPECNVEDVRYTGGQTTSGEKDLD